MFIGTYAPNPKTKNKNMVREMELICPKCGAKMHVRDMHYGVNTKAIWIFLICEKCGYQTYEIL